MCQWGAPSQAETRAEIGVPLPVRSPASQLHGPEINRVELAHKDRARRAPLGRAAAPLYAESTAA